MDRAPSKIKGIVHDRQKLALALIRSISNLLVRTTPLREADPMAQHRQNNTSYGNTRSASLFNIVRWRFGLFDDWLLPRVRAPFKAVFRLQADEHTNIVAAFTETFLG